MKLTVIVLVGLLAGAMGFAIASQKRVVDNAGPKPKLAKGGVAYIRVKHYTVLSGEPQITDSLGGTAYTLKMLPPQANSGVLGIDAPVATAASDAATFSYGDAVTLIEKKQGRPEIWKVAKGQTTAEIPAYLLTASQHEIDYLRNHKKIPATMAFVYEGDHMSVWGVEISGIAGSALVESHGLALTDWAKGTSPFAVEGNAVIFDKSIGGFEKSPVFDAQKRDLPIDSGSLYLCVSGGSKPSFERVDLSKL